MSVVPHHGRLVVAPRDFPTNKGGLCRKGFTAAELLDAPDRLMTPLMRERKGSALLPVSWPKALDRIAEELRAIRISHGADAVGVFGGGGLTNEKAYMLGKFARVALRTANIDYNGRFCMASAAAAGLRAFGIDRGLPFPLADIPWAAAILLAGGNPAETMPPIMQYFEEQRRRGGQLIVVDPRASMTAKHASLHLQLTPGTDAALANGLVHVAIQDRLIDGDFIAARTSGFEPVRRVVASYWPDRVERITGVPARNIIAAAHIMGEAATAMVLTGKPFCGYGCLTGQGNGQGGREHGQKSDQLPGYRQLDNPNHRADVAKVWGIDPDELPRSGLTACEILAALGTTIRGLLVFASNIVVSAPDATAVTTRLDSLDLLVVADMFLSETAARADVVLPIAQWAEEQGTMTNLEGRVLLRRRVRPPPEGVWTDAEILKALADRLGAGRYFTADTPTTFEEFRRATAGGDADYSGITYNRIVREDGVFWPCPAENHPGSPRLFHKRFATEDGRARFHPVEYQDAAEVPDSEYPYFLTTGRVLAQYQSGTQTRRVKELVSAEPYPFVEIHPDTARSLGIASGDNVRLITRRGRAVMKARLSRDTRFDTLFAPFHWGGAASANALTNAALDPVSRIPEFKVCAVRVEKIAAPSPERGETSAAILLH